MADVTAKLESIISGHKINEDDAAWLRGVLAPVAQAEPCKPLTDDQHRRMCALYFGDCSARMHDFLIEYGKRVEAAHGIGASEGEKE